MNKIEDPVRQMFNPPVVPLQTPLHLAVITNQAEVCQHLLQSGCDPTLVDNRGDSPLHIACRHGNLLCFSVITQNCQKEHLHKMMAACNYHGKTVRTECYFCSSALKPYGNEAARLFVFCSCRQLNCSVSALLGYSILWWW